MKSLHVLASLCAVAFAAGCATSSVELRTFKIAGGESILLPIEKGGAKSTENADVKIEVTGFMFDGAKKEIIYTFGFREKKAERPRAVRVEDVTGVEAQVLVDDSAPQLSSAAYWKGNAAPKKKGDPELAWLSQSGDTIKVFRFVITTADGRVLVMHQASVWSGRSKPVVRKMLGYES